MKVSIIIPTYNGSHKILKTLKCLEKQSFKNFEVIVVIDGSTDCTADLLKKQKFDFQSFKIIEQANQGRAKVRNNGAEISQCDLLIFFDDDMRPLQDCVLKHVEHQKKYFESILTGGVGMDLNQCKRIFNYIEHI